MIDPAIAARRAGSGFPDLSAREIAVLTPLIVADPRARVLPRPGARRDQPVGRGHDDRGRRSPTRWEDWPGDRSTRVPSLRSGAGRRPRRSTTARSRRCSSCSARRASRCSSRRSCRGTSAGRCRSGSASSPSAWPGSRSGSYAGHEPARASRRSADALAVDRPTLFLWGTLLALGLGSVLLIADRSVEPGGAFVASAASRAAAGGSGRVTYDPADPDRSYGSPDQAPTMQTEVFPFTLFALGGMMTFVAAERPADDVRRARGAEPAAVPDVRAGAAAPAAVAGGGGQVLPARRVRLGVLPLRARAALRLRGLGAARRHRDRVGRLSRGRTPCCSAGSRCSSSACCSRARWARSTPGRPDVYQGAPTPVTAFMACLHQGRRVRRDPARAASWRSAPRAGSGAGCCGPSRSSRW